MVYCLMLKYSYSIYTFNESDETDNNMIGSPTALLCSSVYNKVISNTVTFIKMYIKCCKAHETMQRTKHYDEV